MVLLGADNDDDNNNNISGVFKVLQFYRTQDMTLPLVLIFSTD